MRTTIMGATLALALVSAPLTSVVADEAQPQLPPHLQALGVTQATDAELAEVRGELVPLYALYLGAGWVAEAGAGYVLIRYGPYIYKMARHGAHHGKNVHLALMKYIQHIPKSNRGFDIQGWWK